MKELNIAKKMKFSEQSDLYLRIKRLLSPKYMGNLFKVILAYKFKIIILLDLNNVLFKKLKKLKNINIVFFQEKMVFQKVFIKV